MGGHNILVSLVAPPTLDECGDMDDVALRRLDAGGTFRPVIPGIFVHAVTRHNPRLILQNKKARKEPNVNIVAGVAG